MHWDRTSWAFLFVAAGHLLYVLGEIDPVETAAYFDTLTGLFFVMAAFLVRRDPSGMSRTLAVGFVILAGVKFMDLVTSTSGGLFLFHIGFVPIVVGAVLIAIASVRTLRGDEPERSYLLGAALNAFGSFVYLALAAWDLVAEGSTNNGFLIGALAATIGWSILASRAWYVDSLSASPGTA